jgi:hypothetical protein
MENHDGMISTTVNKEEFDEGNYEFSFRSIFVHVSKRFFTCRQILLRGADSFTSPPKEVVLQFSLPLKIHRLGRV